MQDATPADGEQSFAGVAPVNSRMIAEGDTATVLEWMKRTMTEIDGELDQMEHRDTVLAAEAGFEPRRVSVWLADGVVRKLVITEPNENGAMTLESSFWFEGERLRAAARPMDGYFLENDRILLWTDGTLIPIPDVDSRTRMDQEQLLLDEVEVWLSYLGLSTQSFVPR